MALLPHRPVLVACSLFLLSCSEPSPSGPVPDPPVHPPGGPILDSVPVLRVPLVVHVLHEGQAIGDGPNHTLAFVQRQIELLNDDFRRRSGTRGFNDHPSGADARIEFFLARTDPLGQSTSGVTWTDITAIENPVDPGSRFDHAAHFAYWDPGRYVNIWSVPFPAEARGLYLGEATGPLTDLPGADLFLKGEPEGREGILINADHFGESLVDSDYDLGRTLTHEMGHYLGLLHLWGGGSCEDNDFCSDTPPVDQAISGCPGTVVLACNGEPAMTANYMTFSADRCMNVFTVEQVERMRTVLRTSPYRTFEVKP